MDRKISPESEALHIDTERLGRLQRWAALAARSSEEDDYLRDQLNRQLQEMVVKVLDARLDETLSSIEPTAYGVDIAARCAPMREDVIEPWPDVDALLDAAPRTQDRYFVVPASEHETL